MQPAGQLPSSVQEIADVIGRERALHLIGKLPSCGSRSWRLSLYVPQSVKADSQLVRILGWDDAEKMTRSFGGMILQPSACRHLYKRFRNAQVEALHAQGIAVAEIAEHFDVTPRTVRNIVKH